MSNSSARVSMAHDDWRVSMYLILFLSWSVLPSPKPVLRSIRGQEGSQPVLSPFNCVHIFQSNRKPQDHVFHNENVVSPF